MLKVIALSFFATVAVAAPFVPSAPVQAQAAAPIIGTWETEDRVLKIEIFETAGSYAARMLYGKRLLEADGRTFKRDTYNPDASLRARSLEGIVFLRNLKWNATNKRWEGGEWYDGSSGRTVSARATMANGKLEMRVYRGTPVLGRTLTLRRVAS